MLQKFDHAVSSRVTTPLQAAQYKIQRKWLQDGTVPQLEFILFNNAFIAPAPNTSYIALPAIALVWSFGILEDTFDTVPAYGESWIRCMIDFLVCRLAG